MPLDRHAQRFLRMLALSGPPADTSAARRRRDLEALHEIGETEPEPYVTADDLEVAGRPGRIYATEGLREPAPGLVYLHGGGWVAGSLETHDGFCRRLAKAAGCKVVAVGYRLAPEHPFPAGLEDAGAALAWTRAQAQALGLDPGRIGLAGDSAGGGLAAAASLAAEAPPSLLLLVCPILDVARQSASRLAYADGYFLDQATLAADLADYLPPGVRADDPRISPLLAADLGDLPQTLIHTAEFDPFRDEAAAFASQLETAGVPVRHTDHPGMIHYFYALPRAIPYALQAAEAIGAEVQAAFGV